MTFFLTFLSFPASERAKRFMSTFLGKHLGYRLSFFFLLFK